MGMVKNSISGPLSIHSFRDMTYAPVMVTATASSVPETV